MKQHESVKLQGIYRHYKGKLYRVTGVARHSESLEQMVVYECLYDNPEGQLWVRPLEMFLEKVAGQPRFEYIGDQKAKDRI
jgi:hypothetical protein